MSMIGLPSRSARWSAADQVVSSFTNYLLLLFALRLLNLAEFGTLSVILAGYSLAIGLNRAVVAEPYVLEVEFDSDQQFPDSKWATGASLGLGLLIATVGVGAAAWALELAIPTAVATIFLAPLLLLQDTQRYVCIAVGRGRLAAALDGIWLAGLLAGSTVVSMSFDRRLPGLLLAWGLAGGLSALIGQVAMGTAPGWSFRWLRSRSEYAGRLCLEFLVGQGGAQLLQVVLAGLLGLAAFGLLRQGMALFAPLNTAYAAVMLMIVPDGLRRGGNVAQATLGTFRTGVVLVVGTLLWVGIVVFFFDPAVAFLDIEEPGRVRALLLPLAVQSVAGAVIGACLVGFRILRDVRRSLRARLLGSGALIAGGLAGGLFRSPELAAYGIAVGTSAGAVIWVLLLSRRLPLGDAT